MGPLLRECASLEVKMLKRVGCAPLQTDLLQRTVKAPNSKLMVHIDLCGDGVACPPPGHPQPTSAYFSKSGGDGGGWVAEPARVAANAVIRLNDTGSRGFGSILLNTSTNTTATAYYQDWVVDGAGQIVMSGKVMIAPVTGLPQMLQHVKSLPIVFESRFQLHSKVPKVPSNCVVLVFDV
jgi:hypothetical protein